MDKALRDILIFKTLILRTLQIVLMFETARFSFKRLFLSTLFKSLMRLSLTKQLLKTFKCHTGSRGVGKVQKSVTYYLNDP